MLESKTESLPKCVGCIHFTVCGSKNTEQSKDCGHLDYEIIETDMFKCCKEDTDCMELIKNHLAFMIGHNMIGVTSKMLYFRGHYFDITLTGKQKVTNPELRKDK